MSQPSTEDVPEKLSRRSVLVLAVLLVSTFIVLLNETIMNVALVSISEAFDISTSTAQWLTTAYLLTMAIVIPTSGFLIKRFSTRALFLFAMGMFTLGALVSFIAPAFVFLVAGRVVQAVGAAVMLPLLMTAALSIVPAARRGRIMGNVAIVISTGPALGPAVSGLLLTWFSWRSIFVLILPISVLALLLGLWKLTNLSATHAINLDILSIILSALGFGGFVYAVSSFESAVEGPTVFIVPAISFVVGVAALVWFILRQVHLQRAGREPLLDVRVFRQGPFASVALALTLLFLTLFGTLILVPIYLQQVLGVNELVSGLILLPGGLLMGVLAPPVGSLYDRFGPRPLVVPGAVIAAAAFWLLTFSGVGGSIWYVLGVSIALFLGLAFMITPLFTLALGSLPADLYAYGSATISTLQQVGGAIGTAAFVAIMSVVSSSAADDGAESAAAEWTGVHASFVTAGVLSLVVLVLMLFIRRPTESTDQG